MISESIKLSVRIPCDFSVFTVADYLIEINFIIQDQQEVRKSKSVIGLADIDKNKGQ